MLPATDPFPYRGAPGASAPRQPSCPDQDRNKTKTLRAQSWGACTLAPTSWGLQGPRPAKKWASGIFIKYSSQWGHTSVPCSQSQSTATGELRWRRCARIEARSLANGRPGRHEYVPSLRMKLPAETGPRLGQAFYTHRGPAPSCVRARARCGRQERGEQGVDVSAHARSASGAPWIRTSSSGTGIRGSTASGWVQTKPKTQIRKISKLYRILWRLATARFY